MKTIILLIIMSFTANAQNWELLYQPEENSYFDLLSYDNNSFLLVNDTGLLKLYRTSDDGLTWKRIIEREDQGNKTKNFSITSTISKGGFIFIPVGYEGEIIRVQVNSLLVSKIETNNIINSIDMLDNNSGVASTDKELFITHNSWVTSEKKEIENIRSVAYTSKAISYITHSEETGAEYYRSINEGVTWENSKINEINPEKLYFINEDNGFLVGKRIEKDKTEEETYFDVIYKTTNGGINWKVVLDNKKDGISELADIEFKGDIGIASGLSQSIYITYDKGENWEKQEIVGLENEKTLLSVCGFLNDRFLLAIRNKGVYSKQEPILSVEIDNTYTTYGIDIQKNVIKFDDNGTFEYEISGLDGVILKKGSFSSEINIENLNTGVYFLRLNNKEVIKFIK